MYKSNRYEIFDDYAIIYVERRNKDVYEVLVDTEDLDLLKTYCWHVGWHKDINNFYAETTEYLGKEGEKYKYKTLLMHKIIMNAQKGEYVDHIEHNTLDNRKTNLRKSTNRNNVLNRISKNRNNTSGYRNVCWDKSKNKWIVQLQVNGVNSLLGEFDDVDEAGIFAENEREKIYGEYAGKS